MRERVVGIIINKLQYLYCEYFLESRMMGNYHVRFGKGVNYVLYTKQFTLVHYNSIITSHAILMIFFMVNYMLHMLNSSSVSCLGKVKEYHSI